MKHAWTFPSIAMRSKGKVYKRPDYGSVLVAAYQRMDKWLVYIEYETMDSAQNCEIATWCKDRDIQLAWGTLRQAWYRQREVSAAEAMEFKLRWM